MKKTDENQIWSIVFTVLPVVLLMNVGNELSDDGGMRVLYGGVFGGLGGLIGVLANYLTKDKKRIIKIFTSIAIIAICGLSLYFLISKQSDKEILEQNWLTQKIGMIEFDSPSKLKLHSSEIPKSMEWFYSELNLYKDEGGDRMTTFIESKILIDTLSINKAYSGALEGMLQKMKVKMEDVKFEIFNADEEEVSSMFSFKLNGEEVNGYGFVFKNKNRLESIWLLPLKRGFSKAYIEEFEAGIIPDYR